MANDYGDGVSRVLDPTGTQYLSVIWQEGLPPLDAELTLAEDLAAGWDRQKVLSGNPSGWLSNDVNSSKDFITNPNWSNWFKFGRQRSGDKQSLMWASVNGWLIPVTGTQTGTPPGSPDDVDTWNKITLDPPPGSAGDARADFVFLEVWKARIAPYPSTLNKPNGSAIFKYGNVEGGFSFLSDDLTDPEIGEQTTERIQLQYRIRVVKGLINLATNPDGFDPSTVKAQGTQATPPSVGGYSFTNMKEELSDPGLWRAGDGTQNVLGTVDGYVYAIPIAVIFRRNGVAWFGDPFQNLNGSLNRNQAAVDRTGATTFTVVPTLASPFSATDISITLVAAAGTPLPQIGTIQIGDEILSYNGISGNTIGGLNRGATIFGTIAEDHPAGATVKLLSGRPDGLFSDQITNTDILDLRHAINPSGFDYQSLLQANLDKLLKGQLRSNWKRSGGDPRGSFVFYEDKISTAAPVGLGITALDKPDHIRLVWSDAAMQQPVEVICKPLFSTIGGFPVVTQTLLDPVGWDLELSVNTLHQTVAQVWTSETVSGDGLGDQIQIPIAQFQSPSLPGADVDQVRFLNEVPVSSSTGVATGIVQFTDSDTSIDYIASLVYPGDTLVIFSTASYAGGSYTILEVTSTVLTCTTSVPAGTAIAYEVRRGVGSVQIRLEGLDTPLPQHRFSVTPHNTPPSTDLVIQFKGSGSPFPTSSTPTFFGSQTYITTHIQYGGGRGLSRRPDSIHNVVLFNPTAGNLIPSANYPLHNFSLPTAWTALWSKFRNTPYKGQLPTTASSFADLGSKTIILTPIQGVQFPHADYLNASALPAGRIMPPGPVLGTPDPLGLFHTSNYVTLPRHLVPGWGAVLIPILTSSDVNFSQGINYMLMSQVGTPATNDSLHNPWYINYTNAGQPTCSLLSTHVLPGLAPASYNTSFIFGSYTYAGTRLFNDDPTTSPSPSTARGLGRQGIELPPYYGIARLFAVYEASDYVTNGSAFNIATDRTPTGSPTAAKNLLRQSFDGPTFWVELDSNGVSTFIINAEAIDITRSTNVPIVSGFSSGKYVVEANLFGFDQGSFDLTQPFRLAISASKALTQPATGPRSIIPGPLRVNDQVLINYSRTPYQGDPFGTQTAFTDTGYIPGPLTSAIAFQLSSTQLTASALTRPNQKPLEVLASVGFITTLGTGRLSGDFVAPNIYDFRNVGYEDPLESGHLYPPPVAVYPRPIPQLGAIGSSSFFSDLEANPEYLGLTTRLPLGALYRDKDFHGSRFSNEMSSPLIYLDKSGVGSGVAGLSASKTLDQDETLSMPASISSGMPGDVLVLVDGEQNPANYGILTNFRTARGGSVFMGSGDRPGGEIFATYEKVQGSVSGTRAVIGRAMLVRNAPTSVTGPVQVSAGDELMLAIVTQVMELSRTPSEAIVLLGTNGSNEGYSAADLYRIEGHPLIANHTFYDVDPSTVDLPIGKTILQVIAPPDAPVIPIGAANTVYASDGLRNFWTNAPTVVDLTATDLFAIDAVTIGPPGLSFAPGFLNFTKKAGPVIQQLDADPGVNGNNFFILSQKATATASTTSSFFSGILSIRSGEIASPTPGWLGGSGSMIFVSGNVDNNVVGNTGPTQVGTGINFGTGNTGQASLSSGTAHNGSSGGVVVGAGAVIGTVGSGGTVSVLGGSVSNAANPSGNAGGVVIQAGSTLATAGNGGNVSLIAGFGNTSNGTVRVALGPSTTTYAVFNNLDLVLGPLSPAGNYGIQFTAVTTNPTISQATGTGFGAILTLRAQAGGPGNNGGGGVSIISGLPTGSGNIGDINLFNGTLGSLRTSVVDSESAFFGTYITELGDSFFSHDYSLTFSSRATNPKIGQKPTNGPGETLTLKASDVSAVFTGRGGDLQLEGGNGISGDGGDIVLVPGLGPGGNPGRVIGGKDVSSGSGRSLSIIAQTTTAGGFSGGDLNLNGGNGDFTGGAVWLNGGIGSGGTGGNIFLNSGTGGSAKGQIFMRVAGFECLTLTESGPRVRAGSGPFGLHFETSNPGPTTVGDGCLFVNISKSLIYQTVPTDIRVLEGTVARIVDTSTFTGSPVTSSSPTALIGSFPTFTGVVDGDIIEGTAFVHITAAQSVGQVATFYLIVKDGSTLDTATCTISLSAATGIDQTITVPFSYTASGTSGVVEFRPEAASSDGTTPVTVSKPNSNGKWLFAKHTRP